VKLYRDFARFKNHLLETSPGDRAENEYLCEQIQLVGPEAGIPLSPPDQMNALEIIRLISSSGKTRQLAKRLSLPLAEYLQRFRHPAIRLALASAIPPEYCAYVLVLTLASFMGGNADRPMGGSRALARRMADTFLRRGGTLTLGQAVKSIILSEGKATGVELAEGETIPADYVVPATDVHVTLNTLLPGRPVLKPIADRDNQPDIYPLPTVVMAAFAVDLLLADLPHSVIFPTPPFAFEDHTREVVQMEQYAYEPSFAPRGKTVLHVIVPANYAWWVEKRKNLPAYRAEKARVATALAEALSGHFPQFQGKIRSLDVATPVTYERYCGAYRGAYMAYSMTPGAKSLMLDGRIKGIKNLFLAGQFLLSPGGLPVAAITGRWAVQRLCKAEKISWRW
jgi:phytoene dehydrogenase-like protein